MKKPKVAMTKRLIVSKGLLPELIKSFIQQ
uniref:Uncharacterized protein n=1 Tax=Rhizophora mucronata TaxID=61149 RepID=A0A2P2Q0S2_RHIMU